MTEEIEILIPCPSCGAELWGVSDFPRFWADSVTLAFTVIKPLKASCPACGLVIDLADIISSYSRLYQKIFGGQARVSDDVEGLLRALKSSVDSLSPGESRLTRQEALIEYFGLATGQKKTLREVGENHDLGPARVGQILGKSLRTLRHPTRSSALAKAWRTPSQAAVLSFRLEESETEKERLEEELRKTKEELSRAKEFIDQSGLLDQAFPKIPLIRIEQLDIPMAMYNTLRRNGLVTSAHILRKQPREIRSLIGVGKSRFASLVTALEQKEIDLTTFWGEDYAKYKNR